MAQRTLSNPNQHHPDEKKKDQQMVLKVWKDTPYSGQKEEASFMGGVSHPQRGELGVKTQGTGKPTELHTSGRNPA